MNMNEKSAKDGQNSFSWKAIFKGYGCCGGDRDDLSVSSTDSKKRKMLPSRKRKSNQQHKKSERTPHKHDDNKSEASSTHWTDLEDIQLPNDPNVKLTSAYPNNVRREAPAEIEDYLTEEPIDFDSLKNITQVEKNQHQDKSAISALTKNSKKIHKENTPNYPRRNKHPAKDSSSTNGKAKRSPWQPHEDAQVIELVTKYGPRWAKIAALMPGRTGKQVRDRYTNKLKPNIKKDEWTKAEEELFTSLCKEMGHKWSKIASFLPGRTEGQVKNRYYAQFRKKDPKNRGNDQLSGSLSDGLESLDKAIEITDPKETRSNKANYLKIEAPISYQSIIDSKSQDYKQIYASEGQNHLREIKDKCSVLQAPFSGRSPHKNDPTSVISYNNFLNNEYHQPINQNQTFFPSQNLNSLFPQQINTEPLSFTNQLINKPLENLINLSSPNKQEIPKIDDTKANLFSNPPKPNDIKEFAQASNHYCPTIEVLNQCDRLSKRMDTIEFLLANILSDMRDIKARESKNQSSSLKTA